MEDAVPTTDFAPFLVMAVTKLLNSFVLSLFLLEYAMICCSVSAIIHYCDNQQGEYRDDDIASQ